MHYLPRQHCRLVFHRRLQRIQLLKKSNFCTNFLWTCVNNPLVRVILMPPQKFAELSFHAYLDPICLDETGVALESPASGGVLGRSEHRTQEISQTIPPLIPTTHSYPMTGIHHPDPTVHNPFASTLFRDAILTHACHLYQSHDNRIPSSVLSATPVFNIQRSMTSLDNICTEQLIPLLLMSRSLHPHHLPTLLLLGTVFYAIEDYNSSLAINEEILSIDSEYVSCKSTINIDMRLISQFIGRGNVQYWCNQEETL